MKVNEIMRLRSLALVCGLALFFAATPMVFAQQTPAKNTIKPTLKIQSVPNGAKVRFRCVVHEPRRSYVYDARPESYGL